MLQIWMSTSFSGDSAEKVFTRSRVIRRMNQNIRSKMPVIAYSVCCSLYAIHEEAVKRKGCRTVIMKGREYKGYVYVSEEGMRAKEDFDYWIELTLDYNKKAKASKRVKKK